MPSTGPVKGRIVDESEGRLDGLTKILERLRPVKIARIYTNREIASPLYMVKGKQSCCRATDVSE